MLVTQALHNVLLLKKIYILFYFPYVYIGEVLLFRFGLVFTNVINHLSFLVDIAENNSC